MPVADAGARLSFLVPRVVASDYQRGGANWRNLIRHGSKAARSIGTTYGRHPLTRRVELIQGGPFGARGQTPQHLTSDETMRSQTKIFALSPLILADAVERRAPHLAAAVAAEPVA
jgi:hypothetical protein